MSCIGDIALAVGGKFETYMHPVMIAIASLSATIASVPQTTNEQYEYVCQMQEGIAEAYVGIAQGLKSADKAPLLIDYAPQIFHFMEAAASEEDRPEYVTRSLIGLVGDLADGFPPGQLKHLFISAWIDELLKEVKSQRSFSAQTKEVAKWTREMVRRQL